MSVRRGCGSVGSSTVSSSASGPGGRGGMTGRSNTGSSTTPGSRLNTSRRLSTPVARPLPGINGMLACSSIHTEYREQMSPSWWLGAAAASSSWLQLAPPQEVIELVEKKKLTEQFRTLEGLIDRAVRLFDSSLSPCFIPFFSFRNSICAGRYVYLPSFTCCAVMCSVKPEW